MDGADVEVSAAFQGRSAVGLQAAVGNMLQASNNADRSDDDESDHTPDLDAAHLDTSHMRGRVSPSPYTANTERARQFNGYVRGIVEQKLDVLVPISHQPRDLITDIIADASGKFPDFASCVRKRIRTFLKSYRRSRKLKEGYIPTSNGIGRMDDSSHSPTPDHTPQGPTSNTAVVTIITDHPSAPEDDDLLIPEPKKARLSSPSPLPPSLHHHNRGKPPMLNSAGIMAAAAAAAAASAGGNGTASGSSQGLSNHEVQAVRQLITGYRESAGFLQRAADQLEAMLHNNAST